MKTNVMKWLIALSAGSLLAGIMNSATAADNTATVAGSSEQVRVAGADSKLLLHVGDTAKAFGWKPKVVTPGKLLVLCKGGDDSRCVPVQLGNLTTRQTPKGLFVEAVALAKALRFDVVESGDGVTLRLTKNSATEDADIPAYNADWGKGRGFRVGETLPDIPLYDLDGNEVRFSRFLGKQYIIYCWASW